MEKRIKKAFAGRSALICGALVLLTAVVYHWFTREYVGDAVTYFGDILNQYSLTDYLRMRYNQWTSRVLIEIPLVYISRLALERSMWYFHIVNIFMFMLLYASLLRLTHYRQNGPVTALFLLYPIVEMSSAGWMATYINYLWTLALGVFSLISLDKIYHHKKIRAWEAPLYLLSLLFAANHETYCVMHLCLLVLFAVLMVWNKKRWSASGAVLAALEFLIVAGSLVFVLTCPGNWARNAAEIRWMRDFPSLTLVDKLTLGVNDTLNTMESCYLVFLCFTVLLFLCALVKPGLSGGMKAVAAVPAVITVCRSVFQALASAYFPQLMKLFTGFERVDSMNYYIPSSYLPFIINVALIICVCVALLWLYKDPGKGIQLLFLFLSGLATRVIMGFSPTLYASGPRTFIFFEFCLAFCAARMLDYSGAALRRHPRLDIGIRCALYGLAAVAVTGNIAAICTMY